MGLFDDLRTSRAPVMCFATMGAMWGSFAALVPQIKASVGASDAAFGTAIFVASSMLVVAMWAAPRIEARLGLWAMSVMTGAMCVAFLLPGLAPSIVVLALFMGATAFTSGATDVIMNSRIAALEEQTGRPLMNLNHAMFSLSYMMSALFAGAGREAGWSAFAVLGCVVAVGLLVLPLSITRTAPLTAESNDAGPPLRAGPVVLWGGLIVFAGFLGEHAAETWSALHLERTLGGRAAEGAMGPALLGGTMFLGRMLGQVAAHRISGRRLLTAGSGCAAIGAALAATAPTLGQAYAGFALLGFGVSVLAPTALGMVGKRVAQSVRTQVIARVSMIGFMGFFIGPVFMGGVSSLLDLRWAFASLIVFMLLVPLALVPLSRMPTREPRA